MVLLQCSAIKSFNLSGTLRVVYRCSLSYLCYTSSAIFDEVRYTLPISTQSSRLSELFESLYRMARYFREQDIDEFRECFYLFARSGQIRTLDELTIIMRSLGMSPTIQELKKYMKDKGGKMSFADFLEVMHVHSQAEDLPREVVEAFRAADSAKKGVIPARQLRHMLLHWGEQLSTKEVEQIFREANVSSNGQVQYQDFVKIACAPVPDYY